ncbi:MAG: hypothetical protein GY917_10270 [Planctomycetaceae bacterium]|nr:hypothetical protein [Planctomycetaceae bacterium]MCP4813889.1 hypothetical protein [Planctomycetaceae bacterium]
MNQPTPRQQCLAALLVSGCFLAGTLCETWVGPRQATSLHPTPLAHQHVETVAPVKTAQLDRS